MKDPVLKKCPHCKKQGLKRLMGGGAGLIFKGSGFYITDYKKKTGAPDAAKSGGEKAGGEKAAPAKAEAKPAAK
jgi:predicted nucleic acid-binding Zn ribbon protein